MADHDVKLRRFPFERDNGETLECIELVVQEVRALEIHPL
jgi:hypothetical protein